MVAQLGFSVKTLRGRFVNKESILTPLQRAYYRGLKAIGAQERKIARRSMRKGRPLKPSEYPPELAALVDQGRDKRGRFTAGVEDVSPIPMKHSKPGVPPLVYSGLIKQHIYFDVDVVQMSVVAGAAALPGIKEKRTVELMEHGGRREGTVGEWVKRYVNGKPVVRLANFERRSITYPERAFMEPAAEVTIDDLVPRIWEESFR